MHKNTYATVTTLSAIAISAILLTSFTMVGTQLSQRALAQNATSVGPSTNATSAAPTNATGAAPSGNATSTAAQEPPIGQSFVLTGTKSSQPDPAIGKGTSSKDQVAAILIPRTDDAVYSGVLTFSASKGATPQIWNDFNPGNSSAIPTKAFGTMKTATYLGKPIAIVDLSSSGGSGSVPFSGKAILLHASSPFVVTYTVNAVAQPKKVVNNVGSAMALAIPPAPKALAGGPGSSNSSKSSSSGSSSPSSKSSPSPPGPLQ